MPEQRTYFKRSDDADGGVLIALRAIQENQKAMRQQFDSHRAEDHAEFAALRREQTSQLAGVHNEIASIGGQIKGMAASQEAVIRGLGLRSGAGVKKPAGMAGQWEIAVKVGSAMGGVLVLYKMLFAAAPFLLAAAKAIAHIP